MDTLIKERATGLRLVDLLTLTKPRQSALLLVTGVCSYTLTRGLPFDPNEGLLMALGLLFAISGCTVLSMVLDQDIDEKMTRTASRPLPSGAVRSLQALLFGGVISTVGLGLCFRLSRPFGLTVASGFATDLLVYTAWLKRRTALSIAFGGMSGGMPVLAGRVLAAGRVDGIGLLLAGSVLLWIPSHILTLATRYATDYERAGVPVFPNVYGKKATRLVIAAANLVNTLILTSAGLLLEVHQLALSMVIVMSLALFSLSAWQLIAPSERRNWVLFKAASLYMLASSLILTLGAIV